MKRIFALLLCFSVYFLAGCASDSSDEFEYFAAKINITTNISKQSSFGYPINFRLYSTSEKLKDVSFAQLGFSTNISLKTDEVETSFTETPGKNYVKSFIIQLSVNDTSLDGLLSSIGFKYNDEVTFFDVGHCSFVHIGSDSASEFSSVITRVDKAMDMPLNRDFIPETILAKADGVKVKEVISYSDVIDFTFEVRDVDGNLVSDNILHADNNYFLDIYYNEDYFLDQDMAVFCYVVVYEYNDEEYQVFNTVYDKEYNTILDVLDQEISDMSSDSAE